MINDFFEHFFNFFLIISFLYDCCISYFKGGDFMKAIKTVKGANNELKRLRKAIKRVEDRKSKIMAMKKKKKKKKKAKKRKVKRRVKKRR